MNKQIVKNRKEQNIVLITEEAITQKGIVFVMHGFGGFKDHPHIQAIVQAFKEKEYTVISFDTTNALGESDGSLELATATNYYEDLEDVIKWSQAQRWYQEPFYLAGHSLGSFCITLYSENNPEKVKALAPTAVLISGNLFIDVVKTKEDLKEWEKRGYREWGSSSSPGITKRLNWTFVSDILKYNLLKKINIIKVPVLLIVGENDKDTPVEQQKLFYNALDTKKELHIIKGAEHTFKEKDHLTELKTVLINWLRDIET